MGIALNLLLCNLRFYDLSTEKRCYVVETKTWKLELLCEIRKLWIGIYENSSWYQSTRKTLEMNKLLSICGSFAIPQEVISEIIYFNSGKSWSLVNYEHSLWLCPTGSLNNQSNEPAPGNLPLLLLSAKFVIDFERRTSSRRGVTN